MAGSRKLLTVASTLLIVAVIAGSGRLYLHRWKRVEASG